MLLESLHFQDRLGPLPEDRIGDLAVKALGQGLVLG